MSLKLRDYFDASYRESRRSKLRAFYCTNCGTNHDALTPCKKASHERNVYESHKYEQESENRIRPYQPATTAESIHRTLKQFDHYTQNLSKIVSYHKQEPVRKPSKIINYKMMRKKETKCTQTAKHVDYATNTRDVILYDNYTRFKEYEIDDRRLSGAGLPSLQINEKESHGGETDSLQKLLVMKNRPTPTTEEGEVAEEKLFENVFPAMLRGRRRHETSCIPRQPPKNLPNQKPVPPWMGWMWDMEDPNLLVQPSYKPLCLNYRPGAVPVAVAKIIKLHHDQYSHTRRVKKKKKEEEVDIQPMIVVVKRQGMYMITMNPIPNPFVDSDDESAEQNVNYGPVHFIVDPRKNKAIEKSCECCCECEQESEESEDEESSDDDEFEFEFTPPICLVDRDVLHKKVVRHDIQIQTEEQKGGKGGKGKKK